MLNLRESMMDRSPATDTVDSCLVDGLIANMRNRHYGDLDDNSLQLDLQRLYDEIAFARQRRQYLADEHARLSPYGAGSNGSDAFTALIREHDRQCERLDNARKFLKAEKMQLDGFPIDQIALLMDEPNF